MQKSTDQFIFNQSLEEIQTPQKVGRLLIAPSEDSSAFDCMGVDCAFPYFHDGKYYMTYVGWDGRGYRTGLASSDDLLHWQKEGMIIDRGPAGSTTEHNVALTSILRDNELFGTGELRLMDGMYIGTYHAYPNAGYEEGAAVIGLCFSKDLRQWEMGEPILTSNEGGAWENGGLYKSWLMEHEGTYFLFYNAKTVGPEDQWIEQTGVATSPNLKNWKRHEKNPLVRVGAKGSFDDRFASDPCVFKHNDIWVMFFFGNSTDGHAREGVAFSHDLVNWIKSKDVLINVGEEGSIDQRHAHKPGLIASQDGKLFHFYTAVGPCPLRIVNGRELRLQRGISLATN